MFERLCEDLGTVDVGGVRLRGLSVRQAIAARTLAGEPPAVGAGETAQAAWYARLRALEVLGAAGELELCTVTADLARHAADGLLERITAARLTLLHEGVLRATRGSAESFGGLLAAGHLRRLADRVEAEPHEEIRGALAGKIDPAALAVWLRHHAARLGEIDASPAAAMEAAADAAKKA